LGTPSNFNRLLSHLGYVSQRKLTKLCTVFGRLLAGTLYIYTFSGALAPWRNFSTCKIHFASKSCLLLYWQR